jgi:hypothetical protein
MSFIVVPDTAIQQIDEVLAYHQKFPDSVEAVTRQKAAIERLSLKESAYRSSAEEVLKGSEGKAPFGSGAAIKLNSPHYQGRLLASILAAMREDYAAGYTQTISELIHADLFSDFLEMAQHLMSEGYKDPAAVLAGSVLEEHLRKLCDKNGLPVTDANGKPLKADRINADLKGANIYSTLDQKQVTAWQELRNKAAHGKFGEYTQPQVDLMISGIQNFIARNPA